ncbi:MAG: tetratricopeptide repeat protein [Candidatus Hydrogenedentes bacterium]|nr:tetratricopeptide repeat protein [Candidatus Hydrogenedentota bacterium]
MPTLAVVTIAKDESAWIGACLDSVRTIADDIVVGDTGSSDDTKAIAMGRGARAIDVPWNDDFAAARNAVLRAATADWLLHLDADETLDAEGARAVRALVDADGHGADAIEVTLANYCNDVRAWRWTPVAPDDPSARGKAGYIAVPLLRLFRNRRGFEYREPVHENITESVIEQGGAVRAEHGIVIHHHGFGKGGNEKAEFYLRIARTKTESRPDDPKAWHDLGEQLVALGRPEEAGPAVRRALELDPAHAGAATTLANILLNRGELDAARAVLEAFADAGFPHVLVALAAIACKQGRVGDADAQIARAVTIAPRHVLARLTAARIADVRGLPKAAFMQLEAARAFAPGVAEVAARIDAMRLRDEADALIQQGDAKAALALLVAALKHDPEDPLIHLRLATVLERLGDAPRAAASRARAFSLAPGLEGGGS